MHSEAPGVWKISMSLSVGFSVKHKGNLSAEGRGSVEREQKV